MLVESSWFHTLIFKLLWWVYFYNSFRFAKLLEVSLKHYYLNSNSALVINYIKIFNVKIILMNSFFSWYKIYNYSIEQ